MNTITVQTIRLTAGGCTTAPAYETSGGLVITRHNDIHTITHAHTGRSLLEVRGHDSARAALAVAGASGIDWHSDPDALLAQHGSDALQALKRRMFLAVYPPRRWRHSGNQRRRMWPYAAHTKRLAIREARTGGHAWLWSHLWRWDERDAGYGRGVLVRVRQPYRGRRKEAPR